MKLEDTRESMRENLYEVPDDANHRSGLNRFLKRAELL
jgi:hypothetical protein